ncbi:hypothetical protein RBB50_008754 [Rhinocladiella similis]
MSRSAANYKRLIVLCDGTWQNILSGSRTAYPTNIARFARALSPVAVVKGEDGKEHEVEQIVYYQPGVGTGLGDRYRGGAYGAGLSANIRAAYGFLAHNYDANPGDEIFFFGFSRGAYTARAIAGIVNSLGLLTKRGMDYFPQVYDEYSKDGSKKPDFDFSSELRAKIGNQIVESAKDAIKIVGVWETVGFHAEGMLGEQLEFHNTELSSRVAYGYHALALDERRIPFTPTLWQWPNGYKVSSDGKGLQEMKQVWFSGTHSGVGGGDYDPACADISLAWMLAQCSKDKKLAFTDEDPPHPDDADEYYLLPDRAKPNPNSKWTKLRAQPTSDPDESLVGRAADYLARIASEDRKAFPLERTLERIHRSIQDRNMGAWPCAMLDGQHQGKSWELKASTHYGNALAEAEPDEVADDIEDRYIDRVRPAPPCKGAEN